MNPDTTPAGPPGGRNGSTRGRCPNHGSVGIPLEMPERGPMGSIVCQLCKHKVDVADSDIE